MLLRQEKHSDDIGPVRTIFLFILPLWNFAVEYALQCVNVYGHYLMQREINQGKRDRLRH